MIPDAKSKEYKAWWGMVFRVTNPKYKYFTRYNKRGMELGWLNSFVKFYEYMGDIPKDGQRWSLGRIENSEGYFKGNVRWETPDLQNRNRAMTVANSSGVTGVAVRTHRDKGVRAVARWYDEAGKSRSKSFCESVYGDAYFTLACDYRERMLISLSQAGLQYADNHGENYD